MLGSKIRTTFDLIDQNAPWQFENPITRCRHLWMQDARYDVTAESNGKKHKINS